MTDVDRDPERVVDEVLNFREYEVVTEEIELPSALWARVVRDSPDDVSPPEHIVNLVGVALKSLQFDDGREEQVDVHMSKDRWEDLRLGVLHAVQARGKDLDTAYRDHLNDRVQLTPNVVVDGEAVGPEDIDSPEE